MNFVPTTADYTDRQVDIELLKSISEPVAIKRVHPETAATTPRAVAGIQKAVQRYAHLLLSTLDDIKFKPEIGGMLVTSLLSGTVSNSGYMTHLFILASSNAVNTMNSDDNDPSFGTIPDDEYLERADLSNIEIDYDDGVVSFEVIFTTRAGTNYTYVVPVPTEGLT